jgi:hypothetical protein
MVNHVGKQMYMLGSGNPLDGRREEQYRDADDEEAVDKGFRVAR